MHTQNSLSQITGFYTEILNYFYGGKGGGGDFERVLETLPPHFAFLLLWKKMHPSLHEYNEVQTCLLLLLYSFSVTLYELGLLHVPLSVVVCMDYGLSDGVWTTHCLIEIVLCRGRCGVTFIRKLRSSALVSSVNIPLCIIYGIHRESHTTNI